MPNTIQKPAHRIGFEQLFRNFHTFKSLQISHLPNCPNKGHKWSANYAFLHLFPKKRLFQLNNYYLIEEEISPS